MLLEGSTRKRSRKWPSMELENEITAGRISSDSGEVKVKRERENTRAEISTGRSTVRERTRETEREACRAGS